MNSVGDFLKIGGISRRGKNRIREHGAIWKVRNVWANKTLLESTDGKDYWRWIDHNDDPDFEILEKVNVI